MKLTPINVENLFTSCLFEDGEDTAKAKIVHGVNLNVGFNPKKLEIHHQEIVSLLEQCHPNFMASGESQGWSFLNFCQDKNDEIWTGVHQICDNLICLGLAIGKVEFVMPRELWQIFPGGMPYLQIK